MTPLTGRICPGTKTPKVTRALPSRIWCPTSSTDSVPVLPCSEANSLCQFMRRQLPLVSYWMRTRFCHSRHCLQFHKLDSNQQDSLAKLEATRVPHEVHSLSKKHDIDRLKAATSQGYQHRPLHPPVSVAKILETGRYRTVENLSLSRIKRGDFTHIRVEGRTQPLR